MRQEHLGIVLANGYRETRTKTTPTEREIVSPNPKRASFVLHHLSSLEAYLWKTWLRVGGEDGGEERKRRRRKEREEKRRGERMGVGEKKEKEKEGNSTSSHSN